MHLFRWVSICLSHIQKIINQMMTCFLKFLLNNSSNKKYSKHLLRLELHPSGPSRSWWSPSFLKSKTLKWRCLDSLRQTISALKEESPAMQWMKTSNSTRVKDQEEEELRILQEKQDVRLAELREQLKPHGIVILKPQERDKCSNHSQCKTLRTGLWITGHGWLSKHHSCSTKSTRQPSPLCCSSGLSWNACSWMSSMGSTNSLSINSRILCTLKSQFTWTQCILNKNQALESATMRICNIKPRESKQKQFLSTFLKCFSTETFSPGPWASASRCSSCRSSSLLL